MPRPDLSRREIGQLRPAEDREDVAIEQSLVELDRTWPKGSLGQPRGRVVAQCDTSPLGVDPRPTLDLSLDTARATDWRRPSS